MSIRTRFYVFILLIILCTFSVAQAEFGANWTATYYNCTDFNCPAVATQPGYAGINFNWETGSPYTGVNADNFTARFESTQPFEDGAYEFVAMADDGIRVYIDGVLALDQFFGRPLTTDRFQRTMTAGEHTLRVDYLELTGAAQVQFQWFRLNSSGDSEDTFTDERENPDPDASAVGYCHAYGLHIYGVDHEGKGFLSIVVTPEELAQAQQDAQGGQDNILIASGPSAEDGAPINLYLLSTGELQIQAPGSYPETTKPYSAVFDGCLS